MTNNKVKTFSDRNEAWQFMRDCENLGISAGYPNPVWGKNRQILLYTVEYVANTK